MDNLPDRDTIPVWTEDQEVFITGTVDLSTSS